MGWNGSSRAARLHAVVLGKRLSAQTGRTNDRPPYSVHMYNMLGVEPLSTGISEIFCDCEVSASGGRSKLRGVAH